MTDSLPQRIEALSAQFEGLEAAADGLDRDPRVAVSVRRIARSLEASAQRLGLTEVAAGAVAIQRAADAHLGRSVGNFLARIDELRAEASPDEVTVLLVEDNRTVATATIALLRAPGRRVLHAESAAEALELLDTQAIDVVILDLILPDRDGRDVLVQMREHARTSTTPVIVLSSSDNAVARAECLAVGADEFLVKPAEPRVLRSTVAREIRNSRIRRDAIRDGLTGLPNRAGISALFDQHTRECQVARVPLCVGVLAVDSLAEVAMKLGRDAGDRFLLEICSGLHQTLGAQTPLGRWETAELIALLPGRTADAGRALLESAVRSVLDDESFEEYRAPGIDISLSGGVSLANGAQGLRDAISQAERALHTLASKPAPVDEERDEPGTARPTPRILLVEDDRVTATLLHHRLVRDGHEVVDFLNGAEAFRWAADGEFDLAVLDVKVPGMDGFELLSRLRATPRFADTPIIMLTGMGSEADVIRGLELGADDYMLKPFSPTELLARVRRLLSARSETVRAAATDRSREVGT